jgi:hypothetical protein
VAASFKPVGCIDGVAILVQGTEELPYQVNKDIEDLLGTIETDLKALTETELSDLKNGVISGLTE